jgi:hypothetical protein
LAMAQYVVVALAQRQGYSNYDYSERDKLD